VKLIKSMHVLNAIRIKGAEGRAARNVPRQEEQMFQGRKREEGKDCGYVYNFVLACALQGSDFSVQAQRLQKLLIARYTCIPFFFVCREVCVHF
jgi:uncharacterized membrane protein